MAFSSGRSGDSRSSASDEAAAPAGEGDTCRTTLFDREWLDAPHRVLRTPFTEQWRARPREERDGGDAPAGPIGTARIAGQELRVDAERRDEVCRRLAGA